MQGRLQKGPLRAEVARLEALLETAEAGSITLDAEVPEEAHDALTGHMTSSTGRSYGSGFPLTVLAEYMNSLSYPELDLRHLHQERSDLV